LGTASQFVAGRKTNSMEALYINSLPENRSYCYNFLYDNCATRPRDMVEKYVEGKIIYPKTTDNQTYRNLLHECLHPYPWMEFGIDLIIGAPADRKIDERDKMFLPEYLKRAFEGAIVEKNDTLRYPLVQQTRVILTSNNAAKVSEHSIFTPLNMAFALLLITLLLSIIQVNNINNGFLIKVFDTLLFGMVGLGGTIVFFLMYFSEHPATNPNWNFVWLNIISLLIAVLFG